MVEKHAENATNFIIISDYVSYDELKTALEDETTTTKLLSNDGIVRNDLNPVVIAALVLNGIARVPSIAEQTIKLVRKLKKSTRRDFAKGYIIVETPELKKRFSFDLSPEDFARKLDALAQLSDIPDIFITKMDD